MTSLEAGYFSSAYLSSSSKDSSSSFLILGMKHTSGMIINMLQDNSAEIVREVFVPFSNLFVDNLKYQFPDNKLVQNLDNTQLSAQNKIYAYFVTGSTALNYPYSDAWRAFTNNNTISLMSQIVIRPTKTVDQILMSLKESGKIAVGDPVSLLTGCQERPIEELEKSGVFTSVAFTKGGVSADVSAPYTDTINERSVVYFKGCRLLWLIPCNTYANGKLTKKRAKVWFTEGLNSWPDGFDTVHALSPTDAVGNFRCPNCNWRTLRNGEIILSKTEIGDKYAKTIGRAAVWGIITDGLPSVSGISPVYGMSVLAAMQWDPQPTLKKIRLLKKKARCSVKRLSSHSFSIASDKQTIISGNTYSKISHSENLHMERTSQEDLFAVAFVEKNLATKSMSIDRQTSCLRR